MEHVISATPMNKNPVNNDAEAKASTIIVVSKAIFVELGGGPNVIAIPLIIEL